MCQFSGKMDNFDFFGPNLPKNGFWDRNFKNLSALLESAPARCHVCQLSGKTNNFDFLGSNLSKNVFNDDNNNNNNNNNNNFIFHL